MSHEGTITYAKKDFVVSEPYVRILLEKNPSCFGCAIVKDGEILVALDKDPVTKETFDSSVESVLKVLTDNKDRDRIMFNGKYPDEYLEDDLQPYIILKNSKDEDIVVAFLEGLYPTYKEPNSKHSDAYLCAFKHLMPTLYDLYVASNEDLDRFTKRLDELQFRLTIENMIGERGCITLFIANGSILSFKRDPNSDWREYEWGWTSKHFGYKESEFPLRAAPTAGRKQFGRPGAALRSTVASPPSTPAGVHNVPDVKDQVSQVALAKGSSVVAVGNPIYVRVPTTLTAKHKTQVKKHFKDYLGVVPPNWRDLPICEVKTPLYLKNPSLIPVELIVPNPVGTMAAEKTPAVSSTTGTKVSATVAEQKPPAVVVDSTIISPDELLKVEQFLKRKDIAKLLEQRKLTIKAQGSAAMLFDPKDIQASEAKNPSFASQAGIDLDDTASWSVNQFFALIQEAPFAAAVLACNWKAHDLLHRPIPSKKEEATPVASKKRFGQVS